MSLSMSVIVVVLDDDFLGYIQGVQDELIGAGVYLEIEEHL